MNVLERTRHSEPPLCTSVFDEEVPQKPTRDEDLAKWFVEECLPVGTGGQSGQQAGEGGE